MALILNNIGGSGAIDLTNATSLGTHASTKTISNALSYKMLVALGKAGSGQNVSTASISCSDTNNTFSDNIVSGTAGSAICMCVPSVDSVTFTFSTNGTNNLMEVWGIS